MRLKKIKLAGFKSFVDPTSIPFPDDMTAIVGPNGCGKSNVIDAVRWVLGESSAKNLRGDAMTDVIFNGSSARKPVSQCSVELVFDNSSGRIQGEYANYNELSVKRLVTREAQSHYFLNASKCRRRDVTDLFLGTGLGPRSYAIIEQGMISRLIESKPQELRVFIEEAAGISKYKERRRETENRIRHTKENLERLEDVRGELGLQLDKLQRQASAARRYKELKAKERKYKGELAALRWLKNSNQIEMLEARIQQQESEIESFVAQQRGDEKGITTYREQQQDLKQKLTDVQQAYFKLGTDITRLEQNQIHAKQRRQQIDEELKNLAQAVNDIEILEQQESEKISELSEQIAVAEPEYEIKQEQSEQAQLLLLESEEKLAQHERQWRKQEQTFINLKQQVQGKHSEIQSTMNMQLRTQQRISELQQELGELEHDLLAEQVESLQREAAHSKGRFQHAKEHLNHSEQNWQEAQDDERATERQLLGAQGEVQQFQAQITALESMQLSEFDQDPVDLLSEKNIDSAPLWQVLDTEPGWEKAMEAACQVWHSALVLESNPDSEILSSLEGARLLLETEFSKIKVENSLATKVKNHSFPSWLNQIKIITQIEQLDVFSAQLGDFQSGITQQGYWIGPDWIVLNASENQTGVMERASQLKDLANQHQEAEDSLLALSQSLEKARERSLSTKDQRQRANDDFKQAEQALTQQQNQLNLLQMQHQQSLTRQTKLSEEFSRQQQMLEDEKLQSEELAMQVEELEIMLVEAEEQLNSMQAGREEFIAKVENCRNGLEQNKNATHQLALHLQTIRSQHQSLLDGQRRGQHQLNTMHERQGQLRLEIDELTMPMEEQAEQLEVLLEKRVEVEQEQTGISDKLAEVDLFLSDAEKGQQGIMDKIQSMRAAMESTKLECEGFRVRANGVLEQLQEMKQPLKPILDSLTEEANEAAWQQELEKTSASVARLGAVNLAAVEEYEIQAERKKHLDDQNDDLTAALDTLEDAIRKIDKETRSRFRDTYDKVNNDLKGLFPKVFGGGSAYLELTDDDLLETGVAIMARPPGKKNSTIHLLSGGEKALTALSLVFAIFRLNPAPFCLLDEVDAPLDDANVGRFCKLVSEMSKSVQFIYITHNKIAMEMAKHLTGVTMAEPGVSRMVAVDVEEAVAIAQA